MKGTLVWSSADDSVENLDDIEGAYVMLCLAIINETSDSKLTVEDMMASDVFMLRTLEASGNETRWWTDYSIVPVSTWTVTHCGSEYVSAMNEKSYQLKLETADHDWKVFKAKTVGVELALMEGWL